MSRCECPCGCSRDATEGHRRCWACWSASKRGGVESHLAQERRVKATLRSEDLVLGICPDCGEPFRGFEAENNPCGRAR